MILNQQKKPLQLKMDSSDIETILDIDILNIKY